MTPSWLQRREKDFLLAFGAEVRIETGMGSSLKVLCFQQPREAETSPRIQRECKRLRLKPPATPWKPPTVLRLGKGSAGDSQPSTSARCTVSTPHTLTRLRVNAEGVSLTSEHAQMTEFGGTNPDYAVTFNSTFDFEPYGS